MILLAVLCAGATLYFYGLGLPLVSSLVRFGSRRRRLLSHLLAPACGMSLYMGGAVWLHYLGFSSRAVPALLTGLALAAFAMMFASRRAAPLSGLAALPIVLLATLIGSLVNGVDYKDLALSDYFPLTNSDTFAYLGYVDQMRIVGWDEPRLMYPAGLASVIEHELSARLPGVTLIADFAETLRLQSHVAFFLVQRLSICVIGLAASGLVGWLTCSVAAAAVCFIMTVGGNFLVHQVLQQFNSSTMGVVVAIPLLWLTGFTLLRINRGSAALVGAALAGTFTGIMAMASPEAHPFYLLSLGFVFAIAVACLRRARLFLLPLVYAAAYALASFPVLRQVWEYIFYQGRATEAGHPGDWIAASAILLQYAGVEFVRDPRLLTYPPLVVTATLTFAGVSLAALAFVIRLAVAGARGGGTYQLSFCSIAVPGVTFLAAQIGLYAAGRGYGLLKSIDYSVFLPSITIAVAAAMLLFRAGKQSLSPALGAIAAAAAALWLAVALFEKVEILDRYHQDIVAMPRVEDYAIDAAGPASAVGIIPDFHGAVLDLFLYVNRLRYERIALRGAASVRFRAVPGDEPDNAMVARVARVGISARPIADITYGHIDPKVAKIQLVPAAGEIVVEDGPGWLDPEGNVPDAMFRWLSGLGRFVIYRLDGKERRALTMRLTPGPDLRPANEVEIVFADRVLARVPAVRLPVQLMLPLDGLFGSALPGSIRILGPAAGIRQVAVLSLGTVRLPQADRPNVGAKTRPGPETGETDDARP